MVSTRTVVIAALLVTAATGCAAHVPMAPKEHDLAAKRFATGPDQANLYVYRNETLGFAVSLGLMLAGEWLGDSAARTYFVVPIAPGPHVIVSKGEGTTELRFSAEPRRNYFVWQEVKMGFASARSALHLVDDATGREGVLECELATANEKLVVGRSGCSKDSECKGARVCERGACVEPRGVPTM
jgi:hypothetical protein